MIPKRPSAESLDTAVDEPILSIGDKVTSETPQSEERTTEDPEGPSTSYQHLTAANGMNMVGKPASMYVALLGHFAILKILSRVMSDWKFQVLFSLCDCYQPIQSHCFMKALYVWYFPLILPHGLQGSSESMRGIYHYCNKHKGNILRKTNHG